MQMRLPWSAGPAARRDGPQSLMASEFVLKRRSDVVAFLRASMALRKQAKQAPGNVGMSLAVRPWAKTFWTLSSWDSTESLRGFVSGAAHREVVARFEGAAAGSLFAFWEAPDGTDHPTWADGLSRLDRLEQEAHARA